MDHEVVQIRAANQPSPRAIEAQRMWVTSGTVLLEYMREALGEPLETVEVGRAEAVAEGFRALTRLHRKSRDCPFPPEPDWA